MLDADDLAVTPLAFHRWGIDPAGHHWIDAVAAAPQRGRQPARFLVGVSALMPGAGKETQPLSDPSLFLTFVDTAPTPDGIRAFADRHGLLGAWADLASNRGGLVTPLDDSPALYGESLREWVNTIADMRRAVDVWLHVRDEDHRWLVQRFRWDAASVRYEEPAGEDGQQFVSMLAAKAYGDASARLLSGLDRDPVRAARVFLNKQINQQLQHAATPWLVREGEEQIPRLRLVPNNLRGALWLQCAQAIDTDSRFWRCESCGRWLAIAPDQFRTNRRYCSDACRSKAYRRRKAG